MKTVHYSSAGGIVIADDETVLLLDRPGRNEVRLPKGHIEAGESPVRAALRETAEESGYVDLAVEADLGNQIVEFDYRGTHVVRTEHYFLMRLCSRTTAPRPKQDTAQFHVLWTPLDRALSLLTFDAERQMLQRAITAYRQER